MHGGFEEQLVATLRGLWSHAEHIEIHDFGPIPGGFSRETYRFDAKIHANGDIEIHELILRKDPPDEVAILKTSRAVEHQLIEAVRIHTELPVTESLGYEMDPTVFGEPAMLIRRGGGRSTTSHLFYDGPDSHQADDVARHLCESLVELHRTDMKLLNPDGALDDPRGVGIDASSWDRYMDTTIQYYIDGYERINREPGICILLDAFLSLRRNKPRPLPLTVVHGDFNPANFLYEDGRVTALIDWENSRVGDPREDLGWMMLMDDLSHTTVMQHPVDEGGFLGYYNKLTGLDITPEELGYFILFGMANIAIPVNEAIQRRVDGESRELLHLYLVQSSLPALPGIAQLLGYPGIPAP